MAAAGGSTRLGRPKQLVEIDGRTLLRRTAQTVLEAGFAPVAVVLGARAEAIAGELAGLSLQTVIHRGWREGVGSSIRVGLAALEPAPDAVAIVPCDLPGLDAVILRRLAGQIEGRASLVACRYAETLGTPAVFGADHFGALAALEGDRGAKSLLRQAGADLAIVDWPAGASDVDRPEDI